MAKVERLVPHMLKWEGGWSDDSDDLGGETMMGITYKTYKLYCKRKGYPQPTIEQLKSLSMEQFTDILKTMYWDVCRADEIVNQSVANAVVDWGWNSGTATAVKEVQRILGVKDDGVIGNITLAAINSWSPLPLFGQIKQARIAYIEYICNARPANKKFYRGWMNRIDSITFEE